MKKTLFPSLLTVAVILLSCNKKSVEVQDPNILATGFTIPWAIEVIGEDEFLITERLGQLYHYQNGALTALPGMPSVKTVSDGYLTYGGLMDVSLHPQFESNQWVYITYVGLDWVMRVARFALVDNTVKNFRVIFESDAFSIGSRIAWQDDEHFFVSQGSGGNPYPEPGGQDLNSDVGKIHRLTADGYVPSDNPVFEGYTHPTSTWSYGHRDPQGLYYDAAAEILYSNEHGPLGGDELNVIHKGANYGWPIFSNGLNYDETPVSAMTEMEASQVSELPIAYWTPSIAPSCLTVLQASKFGEHNGSFIMGSLSQQSIMVYDKSTRKTEKLWAGIGRVRDIAELPGGDLVVLIDKGSPDDASSGRVLKLSSY